MIHGRDQGNKAFCNNVPVLSQKYMVITVDMRGHGDSDKPTYGYHTERLSKALLEGFDVGMFNKGDNKEKYLTQFVEESLKFPAKEWGLLLKHHCYTDWRDMIPTINLPTLIWAEYTDVGSPVKRGANQWTHTLRVLKWRHSFSQVHTGTLPFGRLEMLVF